jgi:inner membrane protein
MPSPLGHALGGLGAGWLLSPHRPLDRSAVRQAAVFAMAGMAADLDLLVGSHRGPTHGLGAAALVGLLAYGVTRRGRLAAAIAVAYASHTLLDWLGSDTSAPVGIMALWPLSREYYESSLHVFQAISRRYRQPDFWMFNIRAIAREVLVLGPIVTAVVFLRRRKVGAAHLFIDD